MRKILIISAVLFFNQTISYSQSDGLIRLLNEHSVNDILVNDDTAWICCNNGLLIAASLEARTYDSIYVYKEGGEFDINAIAIDSRGTKWLATDIGLIRFDNDSIVLIKAGEFNEYQEISTIAIDNEDIIWLGTEANYIGRIINSEFEWYKITEGENRIFSIKIDSENNKWIGVNGDNSGIYVYNEVVLDTLELSSYGSYNSSIAIDHYDQVWISSGSDFISMYDGKEVETFGNDDGIIGTTLNSLYLDINENLWTIDRGYGLSFYNGNVWTSISNNILELFLGIDISPDNWARTDQTEKFSGSVEEDDQLIYRLNHSAIHDIVFDTDTIWMCTNKGELFKIFPQNKTYEIIEIISGDDTHLYSLAFDHNRILWITSCIGVFRFDGKTMIKYDSNDGLIFDCVGSVAVDQNNRKLFGAEAINKIATYDDTSWNEIELPQGSWAYSIKIDSNDHKWVGGGTPGVVVLNEKDELVQTISLTDFAYRNNSTLIDQNNNKWFASSNNYAYGYINDSLYIFDSSNGLINSNIISFLEDPNGNVWTIDNNKTAGVSFYNGREWTSMPYSLIEIVLASKIRAKNWTGVNNDVDFEAAFQIYPNPANDFVVIKLPHGISYGLLKVYSIDGKLIRTYIIDSETKSINLDQMGPGVYVLNIDCESKTISKKLILR